MATEVLNLSSDVALQLVEAIGAVGLWLKAIGAIVIAWILVHILNIYLNRRRLKELKQIKSKLTELEKKIDSLSKKRR